MKDGNPKAISLKDYQVPTHIIEATDLYVDINDDATIVTTTLKVSRNPDSTLDSTDLVLVGSEQMVTESISVDGKALLSNEFSIEGDQLSLFDLPAQFELVTKVAIKPQENTALEGLYKSGDMYCTQCEAEGFRNITWYLDRPDAMSIFTTTIKAAAAEYPVLLSNGNEVARGQDGDKHWVTWNDPFKKPSYLFALVAGNLEFIEDSFTTMTNREVKLQIFTETHNLNKLDHAMSSLKHSMAWDEQAYGREYDLDIFMIVAVDSFNMGAMENKGLNIFNTSCVLARPDTTTDAAYQRVEAVVGHEYFHNWSGNRVTCRDWFQLSLKEGFTVLRDQQFSASMGSETVCRVSDVAVLRSAQFPEDAGPMSHPIRPDSYIEINNFYTATVYEKGAEVVRMINTLLGDEKFRKGSDLYFDRHDGQAATTEDFVKAMEDANDVNLMQFRHWYSQSGTPVLDVDSNYSAEANTFQLVVRQSCPDTPGQTDKQPYHMPLAIGLIDSEGEDIQFSLAGLDVANVRTDEQFTAVLNLTQEAQTFVFEGITEAPVVSLLRGFSAPVKLNYEYSRDQLLFLISHDSDGFNRWEAAQRLAVSVIQEMIAQYQMDIEPVLDERLVMAFENLLNQAVSGEADTDNAMLAAMMSLPTETYLAELSEVADIDAIAHIRKTVAQTLAKRMAGLFVTVYKLNQSDAVYSASAEEVARRSLKNVALHYLMVGDNDDMLKSCVAQFESADNMTDTSAAIRALVNASSEAAGVEAEKALEQYYNRWCDDALVIDQWFNIQASCSKPNTLEKVKALMKHEAFTMTNPNRMRSLVVAFAFQNNVNFHKADGSGYRFLADCVIELNLLNPQMAARILAPLTRFRKVDAARQVIMKQELERILSEENLSPDVFEIASKSI